MTVLNKKEKEIIKVFPTPKIFLLQNQGTRFKKKTKNYFLSNNISTESTKKGFGEDWEKRNFYNIG